ncbi:hypothetical protein HYPSUDRAFT_131047 [Hypholoma sublateritium FD-334 SS-4]|uniref:Uncharacterized protein n=1 Tax=Hypholoma sublateritium (strain FD-334 SS-4) TaxID=945553 RepID=A0A0D2P8I9_HYPSF|nr:hypothetical protein HYPSUDRAFT_131047 [Hypholoma sublateritium FD-334 SS-4]
MTRRSPPSSLRLTPGPARRQVDEQEVVPKHRMPSMPCAAFHWPVEATGKEGVRVAGPVAAKKTTAARGPWDHSGSIAVWVDVDALLQRPGRARTV